MKKLIGMVDFVLWQLTVKQSSSEFKEVVRKFAEFLSLKLELWMFIPCKLVDGAWVVLEEKKPFQDNYFEYQQAKDICIFEKNLLSLIEIKNLISKEKTIEYLINYHYEKTGSYLETNKELF